MIRFQKIASIPEFADPFRRKHPDYARLSYQELYERLIGECYGWSDYFGRYLAEAGYQTQELFGNFEILQKAWAKENDVRYTRRRWVHEIVTAQVKAFQPDLLFLEDLYVFDHQFRRQLRDVCNGPVKIIGWRAAPTEDYSIFKDLDLVLTCAPVFIEELSRHGLASDLMSHAFERSILDRVGEIRPDLDFTFLGSISLKNGFHHRRHDLVRRLMETTPLQMWGEVTEASQPGNTDLVTRLTGRVNRSVESLLGARLKLPRIGQETSVESGDSINGRWPEKIHEAKFGLDNFSLLGRSRLTFNCHIDCSETSAGNARLFEATGIGTCLVTDWKTNLPQLFEPDVEVVTYRSFDECVEKVRFLLDHEQERQSIATAGQKRTLKDHTFVKRAAQLDQIIRRLIEERAPARSYALPA